MKREKRLLYLQGEEQGAAAEGSLYVTVLPVMYG